VEASSGLEAEVLPSLQFTWRGEEPLDRLHMSVQAALASSSFAASSGKSFDLEQCVGHCSVGLEQLCKVALVASGGVSGCVTVTRLLLRDGLPLFKVDQKSMQVMHYNCYVEKLQYSRFRDTGRENK
jgi:hypothetical protein